MQLQLLDSLILIVVLLLFLGIGIWVSKQSGKSSNDFFLSGKQMPWWILGISMVATTFSADTPNLVTDIVRQNGIAGNWVWWAFLLTGMLTVFVYAKLWRRSEVTTDLAFYELRYSGKAAAFLRGFRALYLGFFFNVMIMASVCLAAIKLGGILFNFAPWESVLYASIITVVYSSLGGLRGVLFTDFIQFVIAMVGSVWAAIYIVNLPEVGGLQALLSHPNVNDKLAFLPDFNNTETLWMVFIIPLAVQWWSVWYPGAEPGGGGYIAQRMLAAKNESHALKATLFFNIAHYAIRPWPWILIALASLVVFPDLTAITRTFPNATSGHDLGYPAMLTYLPAGLMGIIVASLLSAFMSTLSTHLNWGASYLAIDFYKRFVKPKASDKQVVTVGKLSTALLMLCAGGMALLLESALSTFSILLQIGAGTGLIFILRWFWWRINAYSEISGMLISFLVALYFEFSENSLQPHEKLLWGVGITTLGWFLVTLLTRPTSLNVLQQFYDKIRPYGFGWKKIAQQSTQSTIPKSSLTIDIASMLLGIVIVYTALFGTGYLLYNKFIEAGVLGFICILSVFSLIRIRRSKQH